MTYIVRDVDSETTASSPPPCTPSFAILTTAKEDVEVKQFLRKLKLNSHPLKLGSEFEQFSPGVQRNILLGADLQKAEALTQFIPAENLNQVIYC